MPYVACRVITRSGSLLSQMRDMGSGLDGRDGFVPIFGVPASGPLALGLLMTRSGESHA